MFQLPRNSTFRLFIGVFLLIFVTTLRAEKLPTRIYTIADGLPRDTINCIFQDSHGFIWFGTQEGLSRFDGYEFKNYPQEAGLPNRRVTEFIETSKGVFWLGTLNGLVRFNPTGKPANSTRNPQTLSQNQNEPMFTVFNLPTNEATQPIYKLLEDKSGAVWIGSEGLFRLTDENGEVKIEAVNIPEDPYSKSSSIYTISEDKESNLWFGTNNFLFKRQPNGTFDRFGTENGFPQNFLIAPTTRNPMRGILLDSEGRLWVGTSFGIAKLVVNPQPNQNIVERFFSKKDGLTGGIIWDLFLSRENKLYAAMEDGFAEFLPETQSFRTYNKENGLSGVNKTNAVTQDSDGNIWIGQDGGAVKIARNGFTTFNEADGINHPIVSSIFEDKNGTIYALADHLGAQKEPLYRFDGNKFVGVKIKAIEAVKNKGWGTNQVGFQDHLGEWWMPTGEGLFRFPKVEKVEELANLTPKYIYKEKDGLNDDEIFRLFEDSRGDIWISTLYNLPTLHRWERATNKFVTYQTDQAATSFIEDRHGTVWMGFYSFGLARYKNGNLHFFGKADGLPEGMVASLHLDQKGRLWGTTNQNGAFRIDDLTAEKPTISVTSTANGLATNVIVGMTEDLQGRIYFAHTRGVDRYEPETGRIKHYTAADGLSSTNFPDAWRDKRGVLWFATSNGISRLVPESDRPTKPPPIFINNLRISDENYPIPEVGTSEIKNLELSPDRNQLEASFVSPTFTGSENLRYQYKLEDSDADWRELTKQRTVTFASLSAGNYRFLVRAVNADGVSSETPAVISFKVLPPIWLRWWFLLLVVLAISGIIYTIYRYRLKRLLELEKIRTRIATDLHDDIGSSLSQIAILSEVVRQRVGDNGSNKPLNLIADTSRELVDSMSDIVWAINPNKDSLSDLIKRMRRFASDVLEAKDIAFRFQTAETSAGVSLGADIRREVYLMFKECVNNLAKHSEATEAEINISVDRGKIALKITDNGKGFHVPPFDEHITHEGFGGNGLFNLRKRAENLGGKFQIESESGKGTIVSLEIPIKDKKWLSSVSAK